jgi:hypothetical protein
MGFVKRGDFAGTVFLFVGGCVLLIGLRLVHKRPEGEVVAAGARRGNSSGAGAKPEQPVCEQAGGGLEGINTVSGFFGRFLFFLPRAIFTPTGNLLSACVNSLRACIMTYSGR